MKIKIANNIWQYAPTASELQIYFTIATFAHCSGYCAVKLKALAERSGVSVSTVVRAIKGLEQKGLVSIKERYNYKGLRINNEYCLNFFCGKFTLVDNTVLDYKLPKSTLKVYLYILTCGYTDDLKTFPSLSQMIATLHMSKHTFDIAMRYLQNTNLTLANQSAHPTTT